MNADVRYYKAVKHRQKCLQRTKKAQSERSQPEVSTQRRGKLSETVIFCEKSLPLMLIFRWY